MEKGIYRYVLRHSARQQIVLTLMAMASFPFLYAFYELPKQIVNEAILAQTIAFPVELFGTELGQIDYLFLLAALFLLLVFFNQCFKYAITSTAAAPASGCCAGCATTSIPGCCVSRCRPSARPRRAR